MVDLDDDDNCHKPGDDTPTTNCTSEECMNTFAYVSDEIISITRTCSFPFPCTESEIILFGTGAKTTCCETDKCNVESGAAHDIVSFITIVTSVAFAILFV
uniref:Uncharacterized protein LOC102805823 n=1 Tax=Saccoglossus kowalevskii TaxID=10224 RepID=A0ABM0LXR8_SACKO|nr:PREDICTED: uncharacterized protein LOC102805823 [Saccoglossus kowalevskii]